MDAASANALALSHGAGVEMMRRMYKDYVMKFVAPYNSRAILYEWADIATEPFSAIYPDTGRKQYSATLFQNGYHERVRT